VIKINSTAALKKCGSREHKLGRTIPRICVVKNWGSFLKAGLCLTLFLLAGLVLFDPGSRPIKTANAQGENYSVRFYGHGFSDIDRIKIPINPPVPADIGATNFTIEWWMKALAGENSGSVSCNQNDGWITGNIIIDRDIFNAGDYGDFGISLNNGKVAFGINNGSSGTTICATTNITNGLWHHIAITRNYSTGQIVIFVDGVIDGQGMGPTGNVSYRDNRTSSYENDPYLVLGAEKHDFNSAFPSYSGWLDELRLSTNIRYTTNFTRSSIPFITDGNTAALYHFDEGPVGACTGTVFDAAGAIGGPSNGSCRYGGAAPSGPVYQADTPFLDGTPPIISNISASPLETRAIITWNTDEPATSQVLFGETSPTIATTLDGSYVVSHTVILTSLKANTDYVFIVQSKDRSGNERVSSPTGSFRTLLAGQIRFVRLPLVWK
jgi:hypothetical protein